MAGRVGEPVTVLRAGADSVNAYGDLIRGWAAATSTVVTGCGIAARSSTPTQSSTEDVEGRDTVTVGLTVILPPGTDLLASDRLIVRGDTYEVTGYPHDWVGLYSGHPFGGVVALTRVSDV